MQPSYGPVTDNTFPTDGGTTTVVTGDEWPYVNKQVENTMCTKGPLSNEDDSHCQGVYRRAGYAGS